MVQWFRWQSSSIKRQSSRLKTHLPDNEPSPFPVLFKRHRRQCTHWRFLILNKKHQLQRPVFKNKWLAMKWRKNLYSVLKPTRFYFMEPLSSPGSQSGRTADLLLIDFKSRCPGLNRRPRHYQWRALPTELQRHYFTYLLPPYPLYFLNLLIIFLNLLIFRIHLF